MSEPVLRALEPGPQLIGQIAQCADEVALHGLLHKLLAPLGIESFMFTTIQADDDASDSKTYSFLIGCDPGLFQLYTARKWFMNDPYIAYCRHNSAVLWCEDVAVQSDGQRHLRDTARALGFRSCVIAPAHSGTSHLFGVLYAGSSIDPARGRELMQFRVVLRAIAMELLEWRAAGIKRAMLARLRLSKREIDILRLQQRGYRAVDIGRELSLSPKSVHNQVRTLKEKFEADSIGAVVKAARSHGLLY
jgi:DNA-binding CsgD family transcriptional regulator